MSEHYATASCLSCLLDSRKELEPYPEPFRLQRHVTFRVTLSTYIEYILSLPNSSGVRLLARLDELKALASVRSPKLNNYFLRDMSFAMLKELSYAEEYEAPATVILPASATGNVITTSKLLDMFGGGTDNVEYKLRDLANSMRYTIPSKVSDVNKNLLDLAIATYRLSVVASVVKEVHFLYDTDR